jgi:hypothetical protein
MLYLGSSGAVWCKIRMSNCEFMVDVVGRKVDNEER